MIPRGEWAAGDTVRQGAAEPTIEVPHRHGQVAPGFERSFVPASCARLSVIFDKPSAGYRSILIDARITNTGERKGQHSIRINDQFRICFVWTSEGPAEVEIVDYHQETL